MPSQMTHKEDFYENLDFWHQIFITNFINRILSISIKMLKNSLVQYFYFGPVLSIMFSKNKMSMYEYDH